MTNLKSVLWRGAVVAVFLGVSACGGGGVEAGEEDVLSSSEALLSCDVFRDCAGGTRVSCSSADGVCNSGPDSGGWVQCDANPRIYCPPVPPSCTCGSTRYTASRTGQGATCSAALNAANTSINNSIASRCPAGGCNISRVLGDCDPVGSGRDEGFTFDVTVTYSCKEPVGCSG